MEPDEKLADDKPQPEPQQPSEPKPEVPEEPEKPETPGIGDPLIKKEEKPRTYNQ